MTDQPKPVVPTRVIPPGEHLPPAVLEPGDWLPPRPPRPPGPPVPPPAPEPEPEPPAPREVVHRVVVDFAPPERPEPRRWSLSWLREYVRPWQLLLAVVGAVVPIPWTGYSIATTWAYTVSEAREMHMGFGYGLAFGTFLLACTRFVRTRRLLPLFALVVTFVGLFGALHWFDPITWLTGVRP